MNQPEDYSVKRTTEQLLNTVVRKLEKNDKLGAIDDLTEILRLNPHLEQIYYFRGNEYFDLKLYNEAIKDFEKVLLIDPNNEKALINLAASKRHCGDMKGAYHIYSKAIKLFPTNSFVWFNRGHIKRYLMDMSGARQDFEMAVKLGDNDSQEWVEKCSVFSNSKSSDELINTMPLNVEELINEGIKYENQGNWQLALGFYSRAVDLYPQIEKPSILKSQLERKHGI